MRVINHINVRGEIFIRVIAHLGFLNNYMWVKIKKALADASAFLVGHLGLEPKTDRL